MGSSSRPTMLRWRCVVVAVAVICALGAVAVSAQAAAADDAAQQDFQFDSTSGDEITQPLIYTETSVSEPGPTETSLYEREISECSSAAQKLMLSLVLRSNNWDEIIAKKQSRAVQKLAKFFNINKERINLENVQHNKLYAMARAGIRQGPNNLADTKRFGKLEFQVGCGNSYFESGQLIVNQIKQQMADGTIDDMSGLQFGWWLVWADRQAAAATAATGTDRTPRRPRRAAAAPAELDDDMQGDGSGEDDYEEYDDDDSITETAPIDLHPHRHHHGADSNDELPKSNSLGESPTDQSLFTTAIDPEIKESVIKLESDIKKTIENNKRLKEEQQTEFKHRPLENPKPNLIDIIADGDDDVDIDDDDDIDDDVVDEEEISLDEILSGGVEGTGPREVTLMIDEPTVTEAIGVAITSSAASTTVDVSSTSKPTTAAAKTTNLSVAPLNPSTATITDDVDYEEDYDDDDDVLETDYVTPKVAVIAPVVAIASTSTTTPVPTTPAPVLTTPSTTTTPAPTTTTTTTTTTPAPTTTPLPQTTPTTVPTTTSTTTTTTTTTTSTTPAPTTTTAATTTTEFIEPEPSNNAPIIRNRMPKQPVTAGKPFHIAVPLETFFDNEDGTNLKLALLDRADHELKPNSWIQFNAETREIYGLPLEDAVSKWQFHLRAADAANETVTEALDISVQQHKSYRSANHEVTVIVKLMEKFVAPIDWQLRLLHGIADAMGEAYPGSIVVREVRHTGGDHVLVFTNDAVPKDKCPSDADLEEVFRALTAVALNDAVQPQLQVKSVTAKPIGPCAKVETPKPKSAKPTPQMTKNYPPVPRNQVDRVNATIGQLLVFKVPQDTFYDPEDNTDLKLSLLTMDRAPLDAKHWLQFDAKNNEFFGIPKNGDVGQREYLLVAEDHEGLTATDALVVVVGHAAHRDSAGIFEMQLHMKYDHFNSSAIQRRFVEGIAKVFSDTTTAHIQIRAIHKIHHTGGTMIKYFNSTLHRQQHICPSEEIDALRAVLQHPNGETRRKVIDELGTDFSLERASVILNGACLAPTDGGDRPDDRHDQGPKLVSAKKPAQQPAGSGFMRDDYLLTFVLPAVIIVAMLLLATVIACVLHRRRMTGKMEIGDEEERRSFRSKGIPVIFHDELDEKPETGNKSPVIMKDEKPPLLPPSYNSINPEDHEDMDEYVPPPAVVMNGRESRGKSPVTPSYRKPPPYVSP